MSDYRELLLGDAGPALKRIPTVIGDRFNNPVVLKKWDPRVLPWRDVGDNDMPFSYGRVPVLDESSFDEIHAYHIWQQMGPQGDARALFAQYEEVWRVLKNGGLFCGIVPSKFNLWADPRNSRAVLPHHFNWLDQTNAHAAEVAHVFKGDFRTVEVQENQHEIFFILMVVKPSRKCES